MSDPRSPLTSPDLDQLVEACEETLGRELTAYVSGAGSPREAQEWFDRAPAAIPGRAVERLAVVQDVIKILGSDADGPVGARAWLRDVNVKLGGRSPVDLIRQSEDRTTRELVVSEAQRYSQSSRRRPVGANSGRT